MLTANLRPAIVNVSLCQCPMGGYVLESLRPQRAGRNMRRSALVRLLCEFLSQESNLEQTVGLLTRVLMD